MDYAGPTVGVTDRRTGKVHEPKVCVRVLAASNHTFVDVTPSRSLSDWTACGTRWMLAGKHVAHSEYNGYACRQACNLRED